MPNFKHLAFTIYHLPFHLSIAKLSNLKIGWKMKDGKGKIQSGFTLIELLVVISIIGILATLITANLNSARSRARDTARKSDMKNIAIALRLYFNDYGTYPTSNSSGDIMGCGAAGTSLCSSGAPWTAGSGPTTYMSTLPQDPIPGQVYNYTSAGSDTYTLEACLENKSDASGVATSTTWCPSGWMFQVQQ